MAQGAIPIRSISMYLVCNKDLSTVIDVFGTPFSTGGPATVRSSQKSLNLYSNTKSWFFIEFHENSGKSWLYNERHKKQEGKEAEYTEQHEESGGVEE